MAAQSFLQYYISENGNHMCEVALRPLPKGADQSSVVLGVNFMENILSLFDMDSN